MNQWFYPRGTLRQGVWDTVVDSSIPGWKHTGMRIGDVKDSPRFTILPDLIERVIYMLHGSTTTVKYVLDGSTTEETVVLNGRKSVFTVPWTTSIFRSTPLSSLRLMAG